MFISPPFSLEVLEESEIAYQILSDVKETTHNQAFIGGGAPRDWYFNTLASDVDIFVPYTSTLDIKKSIDKLETLFGKTLRRNNPGDVQSNPEYSNLKAFAEFLINSYKIQILFVDENHTSEELIIESFPCNLSQIVYKEGMLIPYNNFLKIFKTNTVIFSENCNTSYMSKIKRKFRSYSFNFTNEKPITYARDTILDNTFDSFVAQHNTERTLTARPSHRSVAGNGSIIFRDFDF